MKKNIKIILYISISAILIFTFVTLSCFGINNNINKTNKNNELKKENTELSNEILDENMNYYSEILIDEIMKIVDEKGENIGCIAIENQIRDYYQYSLTIGKFGFNRTLVYNNIAYNQSEFTIELVETYSSYALKLFPKSVLDKFSRLNLNATPINAKTMEEIMTISNHKLEKQEVVQIDYGYKYIYHFKDIQVIDSTTQLSVEFNDEIINEKLKLTETNHINILIGGNKK